MNVYPQSKLVAFCLFIVKIDNNSFLVIFSTPWIFYVFEQTKFLDHCFLFSFWRASELFLLEIAIRNAVTCNNAEIKIAKTHWIDLRTSYRSKRKESLQQLKGVLSLFTNRQFVY